jgi:hypothetical protein
MSWKSLVCVALLCALASPVLAAPAVGVVKAGTQASNYLDANGNWVWNVQISNTDPVPNGSASLSTELGVTASGSALVSSSNLSTGADDDFDDDNPGAVIFGWETLTDTDPGAGVNMQAVGLQTNVGTNQVFSALGSVSYTTVGPHDYIQIITAGPSTTGSLSSTLTVSGAYGGNGRIAENGANTDTYANVFTRTAIAGDANLDGDVAAGDLSLLLTAWSAPAGAQKWFNGDFTGDGDVAAGDLSLLLTHWSDPATPVGALAVGAVPEPASAMLLLLGSLLMVARIRRS